VARCGGRDTQVRAGRSHQRIRGKPTGHSGGRGTDRPQSSPGDDTPGLKQVQIKGKVHLPARLTRGQRKWWLHLRADWLWTTEVINASTSETSP